MPTSTPSSCCHVEGAAVLSVLLPLLPFQLWKLGTRLTLTNILSSCNYSMKKSQCVIRWSTLIKAGSNTQGPVTAYVISHAAGWPAGWGADTAAYPRTTLQCQEHQ